MNLKFRSITVGFITGLLLVLAVDVPAPFAQAAPSPSAYAGSRSCMECHERFYRLWSSSFHGLAMQPYSQALAASNGNEDVYFYDLSSGVETNITLGASANQRLNDVSGARIVQTDLSPPASHINLYDLAAGTTVPLTSGAADQNPRIDGDIVVFERGPTTNPDVIVIGLSTGLEAPLAATSARELAPVVSGRRVAYERHATAAAPGEIVVLDLDTGTETVLGDPALDVRRPDIDGNLIVWDVMTAAGGMDIVLHDLAPGRETLQLRAS